MLGEYKVSRCSRKCFAENRPLREGEVFYSVVLETPEGFERRDYCLDAWEGPPEHTVGHWKSRMPEASERKMVLAPREVLVDLLRQMESAEFHSTTAQIRYLLALLLLRRRMVRLASPTRSENESDPEQPRWMELEVPHDGSIIRVAECSISKSEADALNDSLQELLYCEAGEGNDEDAAPAQTGSAQTDDG